VTIEDAIAVVQEVKSDFERDQDQGLMQHDLHKAEQALAGKYACDRVLRAIEARGGIVAFRTARVGRAR
jgi:hypothetical protein